MVDAVPKDYPRITPYLLYHDVDAALDFVVEAFGFVERVRMPGAAGKAVHAEAALGEGVIMMGNPDDAGYRNPAALDETTQLIYVYVEDVDAHYDTAKAAGANIVREPADQYYGDRTYGVKDPEGHYWSFGQHIKDVGPEDFASI